MVSLMNFNYIETMPAFSGKTNDVSPDSKRGLTRPSTEGLR